MSQQDNGPASDKSSSGNGSLDHDRIRDFLDAASDWVFEMDAELRFTYVSERHQEVIGVPPEAVIGKTRWEAHIDRRLPEEEDQWQAHIKAMKAHESWQDFTYTLIRDDGERRIINNSAKALFDVDGRFLGYRGVGRDVTARSDFRARLNSLMDVVPDAIITIDEAGLIKSFSAAAEQLFEYSQAEIIGENVKILMPPPYADEHDGYLAHYISTGEKRIIGTGRQVEARKKDGTIFPINLAVGEMQIQGERLFTGIVHDLTELRDAQTLSGRVGAILDRSLNEIYVFDAQSLLFVQVNFGARQNMGYTNSEFRRMTPVDIKPDYDVEQFRALLKPLNDGSVELMVFKTVHQRRDGTTYPVEVHLQLMADEDPPLFLAVIQDISDIEKHEEQLRQSQKMEAIGQLTGGIAHDFNNLLTIIIGNNELLAALLEGDEGKLELLDEATSAAEHGAQLTRQLLAFARQQPLDPHVVDLNQIIDEMVDMLRRTLGENILLSTIIERDLKQTLVDPVQTHNALLNLAINARDAMPDGGDLIIETSNVVLDADAAQERQDALAGNYVRVSVRDTGTGMSDEVRNRVLEPFFTTKGLGKGTGLGLSMVHGFAKQSGGFLEIYSEEGYGTAISFYLPVDVSGTDPQEEREQDIDLKTPHQEIILVVEDDKRVRKITLKRLEHLGYETIEAESGQQALDVLAQRSDISLVFTDMIMPGGMTGGELLEQVSQKYPLIKKLIASGYAEDGVIPNNGTKWLQKPYSIQEMADTLRQLLD